MIISIAHQKGGVGKSTIAFNLAHYLERYNPVLIDLDIQNTISYVNQIRASTLKPFNTIIIKTDAELKDIIEKSNKHNLFIIDTGGFDSSLNRLSMIASDLIITPVSDKLFEILGLKKFETVLEELSKIKNEVVKAKIIFNNISPFTKNLDELNEFISNSPNFEILKTIIRQRADVVHSSGRGLAVEEYKAKSKANDEMKGFANEISNVIYNKNI